MMADAKQGKTPSEDFCNGSSQSRVVLAKPRLGGFATFSNSGSSSSKSANPFGSVLRPPQLKSGTNPFLKITKKTDESETQKEKTDNSPEERLKVVKEVEVPKFVPLGVNNAPPRTTNTVPAPQPSTSTSSEGFVFGQNLSERVVIQENVNNGEASTVDHSSSNGTTELLFTSAAASVKENSQDSGSGTGSEGLAAAAAEYERSHARPLPSTSNCTLTGEEDEINVLQISCRLFAWESGSWRERGRGVLRLNDARAGGGSRLVARVSGSLRVVLNTNLWPDMVVQQAGSRSLRITAADAQQQIKLYLIMGAPGDIIQLNRALTARVATSKRTSNITCTQNVTSQKAAERLEADADDSEFLSKPDDDNEETTAEKPQTNDRLETTRKMEEYESNVDGMTENIEPKSLKRKDQDEEEKSCKRQCPEIIIE